MGKRRRVHSAIDDDDVIHIDVQHSRQMKLGASKRYIIRTPRSPKKKPAVTAPSTAPSISSWAPNEEMEHWDVDAIEDLLEHDIDTVKMHKKRSAASDDPLREWQPLREEFVMESIRREAQSQFARMGICVTCRGKQEVAASGVKECGSPLYRCLECFGCINECLQCCLERHRNLPFHWIEVWRNGCFNKTTLQKMGLRIQLGHDSAACSNPKRAPQSFTVLDINGVHLLDVDYCDCEQSTPRRIQLLRAGWYPATVHYPSTKVSAYEYYLNLERLTDSSRVDIPNTRYKAFLRMVRQYRHERLMKRAGRGNIENGIATTSPGDLALTCAACPQPGINLPAGWESAPPTLKLKNRLRSRELVDPGLHTGLAYFVPQAPYKEHILKHVSQNDISSCSGFAALSRADSKSAVGLRYTGVGMCICARHELIRPLGVGDLQKGERYCNMDFIVLSAVVGLTLSTLMIIYDIACQWSSNFATRMKELPSSLHITSNVHIEYAIPKCHLHAHQVACQTPNSLNLKPGVGRTDGEGIERDWSLVNPAANSTKEMGAGSRHDTLDDIFGYHNWLKTTGLGLALRRKYRLAVIESKRHEALFNELSASIDVPGLLKKWESAVIDWEGDKTRPNPYISVTSYETEQDVRLQLLSKEAKAATSGSAVLHEKSATAFLSMGLGLEETQDRLRLKASEKDPTSTQSITNEEARLSFHRQLKQFREIQTVYMPLATTLINRQTEKCLEAEDIPLYLPSSLDKEQRRSMCTNMLDDKEEML
ncbi:hypothetical protein CCMSSC00406_0007770 [Pleurotus cornucopiae]|uniref:Uncharacterized protein n=1 Tax=Pleurotus cornucopiae TaxID=5321 RepID=A0ACB7J669_PLECO|nr:hypothetical protein CCMSSC00406_0007770 [Pleurotus cornucopiae]